MEIEILGTESLGVRGLSCFIKVGHRKILLDPGVALGFTRHGLHPHPVQAVIGDYVRKRIVKKWVEASDIVISHFHGDHVPLYNANPFQLHLNMVKDKGDNKVLWTKNWNHMTAKEKLRAKKLYQAFNGKWVIAEEAKDEVLGFSKPVPHGLSSSTKVLLTKIGDGDKVFVHMPDTQLVCDKAVSIVLSWKPSIVFAGGPPVYRWFLRKNMYKVLMEKAWRNAIKLSTHTDILILDHHVMRSIEGAIWVEKLSLETGRTILCAADFTYKPRIMLEAWRQVLYKKIPIPNNWHIQYAKGEINMNPYIKIANKMLKELEQYKEKTLTLLDIEKLLDKILAKH